MSCTTPDGRAGSCIDLRQCTSLYNIVAFKRPLTNEDRTYLSRSQCGYYQNSPLVKVNFRSSRRPTDYIWNFAAHWLFIAGLLPEWKWWRIGIGIACSQCAATGRRMWNWVVEQDLRRRGDGSGWVPLELSHRVFETWVYLKDSSGCYSQLILDSNPIPANNANGTHCGCVLINSHYVLTASHCVNGRDIPTTWRINRIHFGEWDTATNPDCTQGDCAPPVQKIQVAKSTPHPQYGPSNVHQYNDIALIRLAEPVVYNDFVKPICLPLSSTLRSKTHVGEAMEVSGWGKTETVNASNRKLKVRVNGVEKNTCNDVYRRQNREISSTQLCAGGERGKDSCRGDSGGPLVALDNSNPRQLSTYLVGLVSYGPSPCGQAGWPGVYTKVSEYVDWIQQTMEA